MPYYYTLLKWTGEEHDPVAVMEQETVETLSELQAKVEEHIGMLPDWLADVSKDTWLQEEDSQGDFILDIEGAEVA